MKNKKNNFSYYLFDWANSPFSTVVITFIFSSYFVNTISENKIEGTSMWGWTIALSGLLLAFFAPLLGYLGDIKKKYIQVLPYNFFSDSGSIMLLSLVCQSII